MKQWGNGENLEKEVKLSLQWTAEMNTMTNPGVKLYPPCVLGSSD